MTDITRPRVSRETRRLLAAAGLALLALWILARLRFPDRPPSPNPVSPVLTQISPPTTFADLAEEVDAVRQRIAPLTAQVMWQATGDPSGTRAFPAWPWRGDLAIAMLPSASAAGSRDAVAALDPPTGLALVQISTPAAAVRPIWTPDQLDLPRYVFSAAPAVSRPSIVPAYISSLEPQRSPAWSTEIWKVPAASGLATGALVFTAAGEWLGIAGAEDGASVIVPAAAVLDLAMRLSAQQGPRGGDLGIEVQSLSAPLASATGADSGVLVTWVDPRGVAADALAVGDVIETVNGEGVPTLFAWQVHSTRLAALRSATLSVRRHGDAREVSIAVPPAVIAPSVLGLTLVRAPGTGSRITQVAPQTAADRAGLTAGDVVTMVGEHAAPTPAQVRRAFDALADGGVLLVAVTRDTGHHIVAVTR